MHYQTQSTGNAEWDAIMARANEVSSFEEFCNFIKGLENLSDTELFILSHGDVPFPPGKVCMTMAWSQHRQYNTISNFAASRRLEREDPSREKTQMYFHEMDPEIKRYFPNVDTSF